MNFEHFVVWGYRNSYHTHSHIHEGFYRGLRFMLPGKDVEWLDGLDDLTGVRVDRPNTLFITNWDVSLNLPLRDDCFYCVHGMDGHPETVSRFPKRRALAFNQYIDFDSGSNRPVTHDGWSMLGDDAPFHPGIPRIDIRWATDLMPPEIEANKNGAKTFDSGSKVINYIGTYWRVNEREIGEFGRACRDHGIELRHHGAGQVEGYHYLGRSNVVSIADNVRLVRESRWAPAIVGSHHLIEGYAPCRIFKNISYGQFGVTNSKKVQQLFGGRLIHNNDPYQLFHEAEERLPSIFVQELHALMDLVAAKHTYVNRLEAIFKAIDSVMEG